MEKMTKKGMIEMLIRTVKSGNNDDRAEYIATLLHYCVDHNLIHGKDTETAQMGVEFVGRSVIIDSLFAFDQEELEKADELQQKAVDLVPRLMTACEEVMDSCEQYSQIIKDLQIEP